MVFKLIKFILVGFTGLFIDFGLTFFCKEKLNLNKYISNSIGFVLAALSNYFINRIWTFKSGNPEVIAEFALFFFVAIIGLTINTSILWIIHNKLKVDFYFAKFGAIIITTFWNFLTNYYFTFSL
tara:strand:+ start:99 stop:473 length:375 start_codon:yes stop_codon:yes gene_type:complete